MKGNEPARRSGSIQGRERDLRSLLDRLRAVRERRDRAVLVTGEPGIGKTHLMRRVGELLTGEGFHVAWGRADAVERAVPYAAIAQALASLPRVTDGWSWERSDAPPGDAVLFDVYRPIAEMLQAQCSDGPVVVVIDDLHYADDDTVHLLGFLVRRLPDTPIAWLFGSRPSGAGRSPALERLIRGLAEDDRLDELVLGPLDEPDVGVLLERDLDHELRPDVRAAIAERSDGNPFFALQLALSLVDTARSVGGHDGAVVSVPSVSRRGTLLERVFPLGENARSVARLACVLGDIDLDHLESFGGAVGLDLEALHDGFDRLVHAELLRVDPSSGRYVFVHDLVRETLYADLGPGERRRLHGAAAEVLLEARSRGAAVDLVELAHHLSQSSTGTDPRAARALHDAGDALVGSSPRSAVNRYRQALAFLPDETADDPVLFVKLARALRRAGEPSEVVEVCRRGRERASGPDRDRLTRYLAGALADTGAHHDALRIVNEELDDAEVQTGAPSSVLLSTRAGLLRLLEDVPGAQRDLDHAAAVARTPVDRLTVLFQRLNLAVDWSFVVPGPDVVIAELEHLSTALDPESRLMVHAHLAGAHAAIGRNDRCRAHLDAATALETQGFLDVDWPWSFATRVVLAVREARWDEATAIYERGAPEFEAGLRLLARNNAATSILDVPLYRRDVDAARRYARDVVEIGGGGSASLAIARSIVQRMEGDGSGAVAQLEPFTAPGAPHSMVRFSVLAHLALTYTHLGATEDARRVVEELHPAASRLGTPYSHILDGLLAARVNDDTAAARDALALADEHGQAEYAAVLRFDLGRLGVEPEVNLSSAYDVFRANGAVEYLAVTEAAMRRHRVRVPSRRRGDRLELTEAEQGVAELVADGLTNRAIAERLAYSVKTVEAYLSRVYAKTGCANRVELANRIAERRGTPV